MLPIAPEKLPATRVSLDRAFHADGDDPALVEAAGVLVGAYHASRSFPAWGMLRHWSESSRMSASLGGVDEGRQRVAVDALLEELDALVEAHAFDADHGKRIAKEAPAAIGRLDSEAAQVAAAIAELEADRARIAREKAGHEASLQRLGDARRLVAQVEAEQSVKSAAWRTISTGEHAFA